MSLTLYAPALIAFAGTIIGAAASVGAQVYISKATRSSERKAVASAIAAEIEAYLRVVDMRETFPRAERMIAALRQGHNLPMKGFGVAEGEDLDAAFPIFRASIPKLGLLDPLAGEVATFYATASAVRATAQAGERGDFEGMAPDEKATFIREELDVFQECVVQGRRLMGKLRAL